MQKSKQALKTLKTPKTPKTPKTTQGKQSHLRDCKEGKAQDNTKTKTTDMVERIANHHTAAAESQRAKHQAMVRIK